MVLRSMVHFRSSRQMWAIREVLLGAEPLTVKQVWTRAGEIVPTDRTTVRRHMRRMVASGDLVRLDSPNLAPMYALPGVKEPSWFRCRHCKGVLVARYWRPQEVDGNEVEGGYLWGRCRRCKKRADEAVALAQAGQVG